MRQLLQQKDTSSIWECSDPVKIWTEPGDGLIQQWIKQLGQRFLLQNCTDGQMLGNIGTKWIMSCIKNPN